MPWMTEGTVHEQGGVRQSLGADWVLPLKPEGRRGHCGWRAGRQFHGDSKKRDALLGTSLVVQLVRLGAP